MEEGAVPLAALGYFLPLSVAAGVAIYVRSRRESALLRALAAVSPAVAGTLVLCIVDMILSESVGRWLTWNAARLVPTMMLGSDYYLCPGPDSGPMFSIYGPIAHVVYVPALLGDNPYAAVMIGTIVSLILYFGPILWLVRQTIVRVHGSMD